MLTIHAICCECLKSNSIDVHPDDYRNYMYNNQLVQNVWPDLTTDQREIIIGHRQGTYYCSPCWDNLFEEEDKYDEDPWPVDSGEAIKEILLTKMRCNMALRQLLRD